ncbi:hypothetical protein ACFO5R_18530 [Halosolutus amylolyticus]|uniref:Uncharacterized protein n=1 Tax=Halosolutus amylolyticus TaxID=2932267 RepID=A0ABD5PTM5_9EURY|nr:hypothetical protein [Halosolutus amylolyticus]
MTAPIGGLAASIVPSSPTGAIAIVASVMLTITVAVFAFLAIAPLLSETWTEQLNATPNGGPSIEQTTNEAD